MTENRDLKLIPDWPRIRKLAAAKLGKTENEVQAMSESDESLDQVDLTMVI
jgi:hypothetical protein